MFCITHTLNLVAEDILHERDDLFEGAFQVLCAFTSHRQQDPILPFVHKNQLLSVEFLEQLNGTLIQEVRHVRHLKTLLGQNYQKRKEDTTPMHSPGCQKCHSHPILHVNVILQLDLHIPNFEALNLNTSAFFVWLEMSTRTQSFTHLRTCTKDFFKSSFLHTISTNNSTHASPGSS